ncbi:MAG: IPT/TIG domain-containing protein [Acidimicrobiales bacterium]
MKRRHGGLLLAALALPLGVASAVLAGAAPANATTVPIISTASPSTISAGEVVTLTGTGFGATQGSSYLQLGDDGVSWGAPGNAATVAIASWSNTSVSFVAPLASGSALWQLVVGSTATVSIAVGGSTSPVADLPVVASSSPTPSITGMTPSTASAGELVTLAGSGFGATEANSYIQFIDGSVVWGAPGNAAALTIDSWSNTAISFTVPLPSGGGSFAVTPGTVATLYVATDGGASDVENLTISVASATTTAGSSSATGTLDAGTLSFASTPANLSFPAITLGGQDQTTSAHLAIEIADATGSGAGWNVSITSTQFSDGSATLPASATSVGTAPSATCDTGASCTPATLSSAVTYPVTIPAGSTAPAATRLYSAAAGSGMGDQTFSPTFTLAVPANAAAGAYSADWTLSLVSGP